MSRRIDRKRAERGLLFRDGKLVPKKDLEKSKPEKTSPEEAAAAIEAAMKFAGVPKTSSFDDLRKKLKGGE